MLLMLILVAVKLATIASNSMAFTPSLICLDRDGVINEDVGAPGVVETEQFQLTPGAGKAIGKLKQLGCRVVVTTNQSSIGKKLLTPSGLNEIHDKMRMLLLEQDGSAVIDHIYVCESISDSDPRKKPNPGMILEACKDLGVNAADAVFVGDTLTDLQAATAAGIPIRILVSTGYGLGLMENMQASVPPETIEAKDISASELSKVAPFIYARNLAEAVNWILA